MDAEVRGRPVPREVKGAEEPVPEREQPGEVLVPRLTVARVVPPVKRGGRQHQAERPEVPVHVRVEEDRVERQHRRRREGERRVEAQQQDGEDVRDAVHQLIHGVDAHAAEPIEVLRRVVHGVERPPAPAVEHPVRPVPDEVDQHHNLDRLQPERLLAEGPEAGEGPRPQRLRRHHARRHQQGRDHHQHAAHEGLGDHRGEHEVGGVRPPPAPEERLLPAAAPGQHALDQEEQRGEHDQRHQGAQEGGGELGHGGDRVRRTKLRAARRRKARPHSGRERFAVAPPSRHG